LFSAFCLSFVDRVKEALAEYGVNAGSLSEQKVSALLQEFAERIDQQLSKIENTHTGLVVPCIIQERVETNSGYELHFYKGCFHRVPRDWHIPRCGVHDLWRMWWIGDTERNVTPLKMITIHDVKHLDLEPLSAAELARKVGPNKDSRRIATKFLSDMRFLCKFLAKIIENLGKLEMIITLSSVDRMFEVIAHLVLDKDRDAQKNWTSLVRELRRKEFVERIEAYRLPET
jgi:hypothetical protein